MQHVRKLSRGEKHRFSFLDVVIYVLRRRRFVVLTTLSAMVAAVGVCLLSAALPPDSRFDLWPDGYTSTCDIRLNPPQNASGTSGAAASLASPFFSSGEGLSYLALALLKGSTVAERVTEHFDFAKRYHLHGDPRTAAQRIFDGRITAGLLPGSGLIRIRYTSPDRVFAALVLSYTVKTLARRFEELAAGALVTTAEYQGAQLTAAHHAYTVAEQDLVRFESAHDMVAPSLQRTVETEQVRSIASQMLKQQLRLELLQQRGLGNANPEVAQARLRRSVLQQALLRLSNGSNRSMLSGVPRDQIPRLEIQYARLKLTLAQQRAILSGLTRSYDTTRLEAMATSSSLQTVEQPRVPEAKSGPNRIEFCIIVTIFAFLFACAFPLGSSNRQRGDLSLRNGTAAKAHTATEKLHS